MTRSSLSISLEPGFYIVNSHYFSARTPKRRCYTEQFFAQLVSQHIAESRLKSLEEVESAAVSAFCLVTFSAVAGDASLGNVSCNLSRNGVTNFLQSCALFSLFSNQWCDCLRDIWRINNSGLISEFKMNFRVLLFPGKISSRRRRLAGKATLWFPWKILSHKETYFDNSIAPFDSDLIWWEFNEFEMIASILFLSFMVSFRS